MVARTHLGATLFVHRLLCYMFRCSVLDMCTKHTDFKTTYNGSDILCKVDKYLGSGSVLKS